MRVDTPYAQPVSFALELYLHGDTVVAVFAQCDRPREDCEGFSFAVPHADGIRLACTNYFAVPHADGIHPAFANPSADPNADTCVHIRAKRAVDSDTYGVADFQSEPNNNPFIRSLLLEVF